MLSEPSFPFSSCIFGGGGEDVNGVFLGAGDGVEAMLVPFVDSAVRGSLGDGVGVSFIEATRSSEERFVCEKRA